MSKLLFARSNKQLSHPTNVQIKPSSTELYLFLASKANFSLRSDCVQRIKQFNSSICMCRSQRVVICCSYKFCMCSDTQDKLVISFFFYWKRIFLHRFNASLRSKFHSISRKYVHFFLYLCLRLLSVFLSFSVLAFIHSANDGLTRTCTLHFLFHFATFSPNEYSWKVHFVVC